ncbi:MAG: M3 family peptidase, partial [Sphingopyxis sp.]|nr:M3 family peptidase [Sphingopyxis sp.]
MSDTATTETAPPAAEAVKPAGNALTANWTGPYGGVPPWDKMRPDLFPDAFTAAMAEVKADVDAIINNPAPPTFENTHVPMMLAGATMDRVFSLWGVQTSNVSNARVEEIDAEWSPKISTFYTELMLQPKLVARYKAVYDARKTSGLDAQQQRIVEREYEEMVRNGANLSEEDRAVLVSINAKLEGLFSQFSSKLLADEKLYTFVADAKELDGLEPALIASFKAAAEANGKPGQYAIKNTRSAAQPVLQYATNRGLRERVYKAFVGRGDNGDANDTNSL